jgi:lysophospholipase L1-like esterase
LTSDEVAEIQTAVGAFNQVITGLAAANNLAVVDIYQKLKDLESGIVWDGIKLSPKFITGGAFSTDGLHPTPRGNALVANYVIDAINSYYGSNIPHADITQYPGLIFP